MNRVLGVYQKRKRKTPFVVKHQVEIQKVGMGRERGRERQKETDRQKDRERERERGNKWSERGRERA